MTLSFEKPGKNRNQAIDKRLRLLFNRANLEYKSSHKFRHGHAVYGLKRCKTMAEYQAVSRNLMHNSIQVTDEIYAGIELQERKQLIANLTKNSNDPSNDQMTKILGGLNQKALLRAIKVAAQKLSDI
jgi:integrase